MKRFIPILLLSILATSAYAQFLFRTNGTQYVTGKLAIYPDGSSPDNGYNGNLTITKPVQSGQYINIVRQMSFPWSIGMVYNTSRFAIGSGTTNDSQFTNPFFVIGTTGNVGIGSVDPQSKLQVSGPVLFENGTLTLKSDFVLGPANKQFLFHTQSDLPNDPPVIHLTPKAGSSWDWGKSIIFNHEGAILMKTPKLGVGTTTPVTNLEVASSTGATLGISTQSMSGTTLAPLLPSIEFLGYSNSKKVRISATEETQNTFSSKFSIHINDGTGANNLVERFTILSGGQVGIGTSQFPTDYKLAVAGKIIAEEVMIKLQSNWPDYVFKQNYNLMPIREVESFVKANHHLPGIPNATTVENEGVSMGEMQAKLLQKIEELTLYIIEQNIRISDLEKKISE